MTLSRASLRTVQRRMAAAQAVVVAASFGLLLVGTNSTTPLLPLYRGELGFSALESSLTFVCYVVALTTTLLLLSRPGAMRHAPVLVCLALALAFAGDLLLATGALPEILAGRAVAGVSGGAGTGSAAALAVSAIGTSGRSLTATGNVIGAVIGTVFSQACVWALGIAAVHVVFLVHAFVCLLVLAALVAVLVARRHENALALRLTGPASESQEWRRHVRVGPLLTGSVSWIAISVSIVFVPNMFAGLEMSVARSLGIIVLLVCSAGTQLASPLIRRVAPSSSGLILVSGGVAILLTGLALRSDATAVTGMGILGAGVGIAYRTGLVFLTQGTPPGVQGNLSSFYAAVTYALAALTVLIGGAIGSLLGTEVAPVIFAITALLSLAALRTAPRMGSLTR